MKPRRRRNTTIIEQNNTLLTGVIHTRVFVNPTHRSRAPVCERHSVLLRRRHGIRAQQSP